MNCGYNATEGLENITHLYAFVSRAPAEAGGGGEVGGTYDGGCGSGY